MRRSNLLPKQRLTRRRPLTQRPSNNMPGIHESLSHHLASIWDNPIVVSGRLDAREWAAIHRFTSTAYLQVESHATVQVRATPFGPEQRTVIMFGGSTGKIQREFEIPLDLPISTKVPRCIQ